MKKIFLFFAIIILCGNLNNLKAQVVTHAQYKVSTEMVLWIVDLTHFTDKQMDCGYGICLCQEGRLVNNYWFRYPIINDKEVHCYGFIVGNVLHLSLPVNIIAQATDSLILTLHYPINILNGEKEIVYKMLPGEYYIRQKKGEVFVLIDLQTDRSS